jgi:putative FmdB family regulatory protein
MPFYEYEPDRPNATCAHCAAGFEVMQGIHDEPLRVCPECGQNCHRILSAFQFNAGQGKQLLGPKNLEKHGFTQYRKSAKGVYEKTAGEGPRVITDR